MAQNVLRAKTSLTITKEQRIQLQQDMGLTFDEIFLSEIPQNQSIEVGYLGENIILAMGQTDTDV